MSKFPLIALCALLAFPLTSVSASASSKSDPRPVTKEFSGGKFNWKKSGDFVFRWDAFNNDGQLEICGLYSTAGSTFGAVISEKVLVEAKITLDGKLIKRGLHFFKAVPNETRDVKHVGKMANCRITKHAFPQDPSKLKIEFRHGTYSGAKI